MATSKVEIYTTPTCQYCHAAKEYFKENEIKYKEYDVSSDAEKRREVIERSGQVGVPVIIYQDQMMIGWDEKKFKELHKAGNKIKAEDNDQ